jgi:hypothetical protein
VSDLLNNKKIFLSAIIIILLFLSVMYPLGLRINGVKPDLILVFIVITALLFDIKSIVFAALVAAAARDLIEFRFPGPYILTYSIIVLLIYFSGSFFYKPGIAINLIFIAAFTFISDMLWVTFYNVYYILSYGVNTNFSYGYNIVNGTIYQIIQNIVIGVLFYYMITYFKKRVLHEKA